MGRMWRICARKKCSRWITRSITSLKDEGGGGGAGIAGSLWPGESLPVTCAGAASWERAGKQETDRHHRESKTTRQMRIETFKLSSRELEDNVQNDGRIRWLSILKCGLE